MTAEHPDIEALWDLARRKPILDFAGDLGLSLHRAGRTMRGECPVCGASKGKKADGAFWVDARLNRWGCFAQGADCGRGGDLIALVGLLRRLSPREAAEWIVGYMPSAPDGAKVAQPSAPAAPRVRDKPKRWIAEAVAECKPAWGTPAAAYLRGRGIDGPIAALALEQLLFHPRFPYDWDDAARDWVRCPAMVGRVRAPGGFTGGVHATYLGRTGPLGGWGKAALSPGKRMFGPQIDDEGRPGGVWLIGGPEGPEPLLVGEGQESALSAAMLVGEACRVVAALALNRLQGGMKPDAWGRINPDLVTADPERPAFTWPGQGAVIIAVDRDMAPITVKARKAGGGTYQRTLEADDRARICAGLASQAWAAAGANPIRTIAPGAGRDFSDELRVVQGRAA